ncbi:MAG TPA: Ig-like domain-containing protein, partial [bacterium]|nr:Ig-like domain-containing protein [bacterium]
MKEKLRYFLFILFLLAIIICPTLVNANGLKVYMEVAPGAANSQILGDTYPRNVSLDLLQSSLIRVEWHNLLTADTFYRVLFTKQSMDLDLTNCRGFDNTDTYFKLLLPIGAYYTDSTPIANSTYEIGPNNNRSDTIKFLNYNTLGYNSYLLYADTAISHNPFPGGENFYDFVFHAIKKGDIGFDIRKDFGSGAVLTGATVQVDSGINNSTLTGGGPYVDGTTDSDDTENGLIYFVEGTHFNANSCTEYGFIVSHPDYSYSAICDSTIYKSSSVGPNMIYVLMRDLNFKITGVEANSGNREDTQYGEANIYYDVDKEDTVISFYVYASESSDSSHNYSQPVTDLPTDVNKWFISISNNGIVYSETNPVAVRNIGSGTYVVTVYNDTSVVGNWGALIETGVVSCTISVKYFQTPLPNQPDSYYFYLSDTAQNMVQVFDIEINNDSWTQPDSGTMIITIDKLGDTITGGRYEELSSGDTVVLSFKVTIDTNEINIDNSSNIDSIIILIGSLTEGTAFHLSSETYIINNGENRIGRAVWFDSSVTPGLYDIYDTVVWKYQSGQGYNPQIIVANDSNLSAQKPKIRVINLNATLEVSPINVDDDDSTYFTFKITNIGDTNIGETITIQLLTPFTTGFDMAETVTESGGTDTWIVTYNGADSTITIYEPCGLIKGIVPGEYIEFNLHANSINNSDSSIEYRMRYFTKEIYPYVAARDGSGKLALDTYILDVTYCTFPLEVHNFNCTFAISSASKVIDDGDTYRITITIYNQGSSAGEDMDSAVLTFTDAGTIYYLSNLQCTTSSGTSWSGGVIISNTSIKVGSLSAGDTGLITFDIWTPNLVAGDTVWTMMMTAYDSCGGVKSTYNNNDINDTSIDTITIKDLAAYYSIATFDAQSNAEGIYLNDNAANTIQITLYNETGATTADTIGSFIIYFDAAFRNSVDTITAVQVVVGKTQNVVYNSFYPAVNTAPSDSIVFTANANDSIASGDSIIIRLGVWTNDLTSDTTSSISITVYSKTEPTVYDATPLNSLNTTNDTIVIKAFEVRIKSCSTVLSGGSQFGDGETITVVINFDTASASGGTNSNTIDSYSIIFEEPAQNIVTWITDYNGMADYDSVTSGSNDTITYKAAKPSANIGNGYCTFVISLNDLSANSYMNVKVIGYKYAYNVSGNTVGFLTEYSDSIRITIVDNNWFNLRVKSAATGGETVEIGTATSLKSFGLIITNPSLTTTVDTIIFDTAYAASGDSFNLSYVEVLGVTGVVFDTNATTAGETIVIYKDNLINTNSTIIVRFYYTTGSLNTVDYQVWNVSFYDTNLATYRLGYDTIGLKISSLSLSSYADDKDTANYNSPGNMIISLVLQNYGGPTGYTNPDSHWAIYIGSSGESYPLTINNLWQGYYDVANNKCNYSFDVTLNTANLSPNTNYSIKVIFKGNTNDTLSEIYGVNTIRFIKDLAIIDSSVIYLTSGATAVDSGSFVKIRFNFNDATLISDSNVSTNLSSGTFTVQITGNQVDFIIPCMTNALGTGETVAFNFITTSGTTTVTLNVAVDTQAPLYAPTVNMVNDTIILTDTFLVNVTAYDSEGMSKVELTIDGSDTMTDTSVPYSFIINVPAISITGSTITITAYDNAMHSTSTQIVNVNRDIDSPTSIAFANITSGDSFGVSNVIFSISAEDSVAIDTVEVYYRYKGSDILITTIDGAKAS